MQLNAHIFLSAMLFSSVAFGLPTGTSPQATISTSTHHHHDGTFLHTEIYVQSETASGHHEYNKTAVTNAHTKDTANTSACYPSTLDRYRILVKPRNEI
jgi:hypothetical protein